jgi:DNA-binding LytR/AlgR family response regulator
MVRFAVCDDDRLCMESIVQHIEETYNKMSDLNETCECILYDSGEELISNFIRDKIDIFFIDVECGSMSGFDIAKALIKIKRDLGIVYITNHSNYATKAFVCRPLGFIRKNMIKDDIRLPMENIIEFLSAKKQKIIFKDNKGDFEIFVNDMIAFEVFNHNLEITLFDRNIQFKGQLSKYENTLIEFGFIKISRNILVNRKYIKKLEGTCITMTQGKCYNISRRKLNDVREQLRICI